MAPLVMAVNLGSTSYKFKLFDFSDGERELASGHIENIGAAASSWKITAETYEETGETRCPDHKSAFRFCAEELNAAGILSSPDKLDGIAFKAVHGGNISGARPVDEQLIKEMEKFSPFAPAHNPMYANLMKKLRKEFPRLKQAAYFETSFHADIPLCRAVYGVPYEWVGQYGIRRYGFHGSSHGYIAGKMREEAPEAQKIISLHLGGSSSICAIENGKSIACSMGATPQSGLFQNNRAGDFDVFCLPRLLDAYNGDLEKVLNKLSKESGFLGLSGISNDLRAVIKAANEGNGRAKLAINVFVDNCVGYIGMFTAYLQGVDAIVFTGGIGTKCAQIRNMICQKLDYLRLRINENLEFGKLSENQSAIQVWTFETNEELMVARQTRTFFEQKNECNCNISYSGIL